MSVRKLHPDSAMPSPSRRERTVPIVDYHYNTVNIVLSLRDNASFDVYTSPFLLNEWTLQPSKYY